MNNDDAKYRSGFRTSENFIPQPDLPGIPRRPGYQAIPFRRPRFLTRLRWWLGIGKSCGYAPHDVACMTVFKDILFLSAGACVFRLDKVNGEMVIVPFHETVCNKCKGKLS